MKGLIIAQRLEPINKSSSFAYCFLLTYQNSCTYETRQTGNLISHKS